MPGLTAVERATMELTGKVALVTGAARRIGRAIAIRLAEEGMNIAVHWNTSARDANRTVAECQQRGVRAVPIQGDLTDPDCAATIMSQAATLGPVQVLINNASRFIPNRLDEIDREQIEQDHLIHVVSPALLSREFSRQLPSGAEGRIVQLLDWRASIADPRHFSYGLAKAGMLHLMKLLAAELAPNTTVNAISPGSILPPSSIPDEEGDPHDSTEETDAMRQLTDSLIYLVKDADNTTGRIIPVNGGKTLS